MTAEDAPRIAADPGLTDDGLGPPKTSLAQSSAPLGPVKDLIKSFAGVAAPNEACGFVVLARDGKTQVIACHNQSSEPESNFRIGADDFERAQDTGEIKLVWHSHYNRSPDPSSADKVMAEKCQLPFLIVSHPAGEFKYYEPTGYKAPLLGRPFVHGVLDCYSLVRDYYAERLGIILPDFDRQDDWWLHGGNLYLDNFAHAGFRKVEVIQVHDVILMQIASKVPNHAAVYLGDGLMMHHVQHRISMEVPYIINLGYYARNTVCLLRHKSL